MWGDYENETLIHHHKMSKIYKKRYQRAGDFHNSLYSLFGLITVISSTVASTISWGSELDETERFILSTITTTAAITAAIQNFYKFQENSTNYITTAKTYAKLQNKIEGVGNIHPEYRKILPSELFEKVQERFDQISDSRLEVSNCMVRFLYNNKKDTESYLEDKHEKYKKILDIDKIKLSKNYEKDISIDTDDEGSDEELVVKE